MIPSYQDCRLLLLEAAKQARGEAAIAKQRARHAYDKARAATWEQRAKLQLEVADACARVANVDPRGALAHEEVVHALVKLREQLGLDVQQGVAVGSIVPDERELERRRRLRDNAAAWLRTVGR